MKRIKRKTPWPYFSQKITCEIMKSKKKKEKKMKEQFEIKEEKLNTKET